MEQTNDQWLWFVDDELVEALARTDVLDAKSEKRPMQSAALAKALALNMDGKTEQALREVRDAIDGGEDLPELAWTKAHLEFQLGHFENALEDYRKVLEAQPSHKSATYNAALCLEKLKRYEEAIPAFRNAAQLDPLLAEAILGAGVCELRQYAGRGGCRRECDLGCEDGAAGHDQHGERNYGHGAAERRSGQ